MKLVVQRVRRASVCVQNEQIGAIEKGLLILVGIHEDDTGEIIPWIGNKLLNMRIFNDDAGKMNDSVEDVEGDLLVVSQFTLYGDADKGNRPSYSHAAGPEKAERLYNQLLNYLKEKSSLTVESGRFGADMQVDLCNDGPVTIVLEK